LGAANRGSDTVAAIPAMRPERQRRTKCLITVLTLPSVDLFTADEELVLATWFKIDRPSYGPRVDDIFDRWNIPSEIDDYRRIDAAVAQILLERIQDDLPSWTALTGNRFVIARDIFDRQASPSPYNLPRAAAALVTLAMCLLGRKCLDTSIT
jgi:hypothetical protein